MGDLHIGGTKKDQASTRWKHTGKACKSSCPSPWPIRTNVQTEMVYYVPETGPQNSGTESRNLCRVREKLNVLHHTPCRIGIGMSGSCWPAISASPREEPAVTASNQKQDRRRGSFSLNQPDVTPLTSFVVVAYWDSPVAWSTWKLSPRSHDPRRTVHVTPHTKAAKHSHWSHCLTKRVQSNTTRMLKMEWPDTGEPRRLL